MRGRIGAVTLTFKDGTITAEGPEAVREPLLRAAWRHVLRDATTNACIELRQFVLARGGVIEEPCSPTDICQGREGPRRGC